MPNGDFRGGQTDQMRTMAGKFRGHSGQISDLIRGLDADASSSEGFWTGPDANRFRNDWHTFKPTLDKLVQSLDQAAGSIDKSAERIDIATS